MRTRLLVALVAAGSIPLVAVAQDGGGHTGAPAVKKAAVTAAKKKAPAAPPEKKAAAKAPAEKAAARKPVGVTKRHVAPAPHAGEAASPTPVKEAAAQAAPAPAPAKKTAKKKQGARAKQAVKATQPKHAPKAKAAPKARVVRKAAPSPAAKTPAAKKPPAVLQAAPVPPTDPELVATARLFFQGLTSQVPAAMAELSGFPFDLDGETLGTKASLVSRLTVLFQGKDFSRLPLYGMKTLPADAMVKQYGQPPARLGKLDLKDAWVAIADLGGHGYVAVFKKKYGRWVAVAYTD